MGNCMRKERASIPAAEGGSGNPTIQNPSEEAARSGMDEIDHEQLPAVARGPSLVMTLSLSSHHEFMREVLERATNGFSDSNFLGKGGFGSVHKGLLEDGRTVAIKQLGVGSSQGDREFLSEVEIITRVHHRHLVSLVGYCIANAARMLVYEFVPNNTLKYHLHASAQLTFKPVAPWLHEGSAEEGDQRVLGFQLTGEGWVRERAQGSAGGREDGGYQAAGGGELAGGPGVPVVGGDHHAGPPPPPRLPRRILHRRRREDALSTSSSPTTHSKFHLHGKNNKGKGKQAVPRHVEF